MKFERITSGIEISDCGRYSVASEKIHGEFYYVARRRATARDHMQERLATCRDAQDARTVCAKHAEGGT